jgi:hypothetical protein
MLVQLLLEYRLEFLDFNNLVDVMLLERECQYTKKGIRRTGKGAGHLDVAAKFIPWFEQNELGGDTINEVDDVIGDSTYILAI